MAGFYDVYALAPVRTADAVEQFVARFAPTSKPSADDYPVPQFAEQPAAVFGSAAELIAWCVAHPAEPYSVYWRSLAVGDPAHAMAFFTTDSGLILGLSVVCEPERWLDELLAATGSTASWVGFEEPPPNTATAFRAAVSMHTKPDRLSSAGNS